MISEQKANGKGIVETTFERLVESARNGPESVVFLSGAGISWSSEHSLWQAIKLDLFADLFEPMPPAELEDAIRQKMEDPNFLMDKVLDRADMEHASAIAAYVKLHQVIPPELLMSFYKTRYGFLELHDFLHKHLSRNEPAPAYAALGRLLTAGFSRHYITANQDGAIERVLTKWFPEMSFISLTDEDDFARFLESSNNPVHSINEVDRVIVANLHGAYARPETLRISPSNLVSSSKEDSTTQRAFKKMIEKARAIVIIGYRGIDQDIVGVLRTCLGEGQTRIRLVVAVGPEAPMPEVLKKTELTQQMVEVTSPADTFLTALLEKWLWDLPMFTPAILIPKTEASSTVCTSVQGAVILAGDYGVFVNGKMIQLRLPRVRGFAMRVQKEETDPCHYFDPRTRRWIKDDTAKKQIAQVHEFLGVLAGHPWPDSWNELTKQIQPKVKQRIDRLKGMIKEAGLTPVCDGSILTWSQYPTGSGAGDGLPMAMLSALLLPDPGPGHGWASDLEDGSIHIECLNGNVRAALVETSAIWSWFYAYQNTSYLRPLASFWNGSPIFLLNRDIGETPESKELRESFGGKEFKLANFQVEPHSILREGISFDASDGKVEFAIAYRPRRTLLSENDLETKVATGVAVAGVQKADARVRTLAAFTDAVEEVLKNRQPYPWLRIGKLMTAAHFGLVTIARGSPEVDGLVGELAAMHGILGAKTSGSGPGGALVVAYDPSAVAEFPLSQQLRRLLLRRGHHLITAKVLP